MTKTLSLLAAAALLAACGQQDLSAAQIREALPKADAVKVGTPEAQAAAGALTATSAATAPQYGSEFARMSYWTAVTLNSGVWMTLTLVEAITLFPPTSATADSATWGPGLDQDGLVLWKLHVTKAGEGYDYVLSGRPAAGGAEATIISGRAYRGADRWHGNGTFTIDFDADATLPHRAGWSQDSFGRVDFAYDNRTSRLVEATAHGAKNMDPSDPHFMNAAYAFDAGVSGGDLELGILRLDTLATLKLHTRWNDAGAGRGDLQYVDGANTLSQSQCWSGTPDYALVFDDHSIGADTGDETLCAYRPAAYATIAIPAP
jgi:hypothetical protein